MSAKPISSAANIYLDEVSVKDMVPSQNLKTLHPLFNAFAQAEYGRLFLTAPGGACYRFKGHKQGVEAQLTLHSWKALDALLARGEIGFADSYAKGEWDSEDLAGLVIYGIHNADSLERYFYGRPWYSLWQRLRSMIQSNSLMGSRSNISSHYDLGNDFYKLWLDKSMTYSSALFEGDRSRSLEDAQKAKYQRILDKLDPEPGSHILDIGCGWGGFTEFAAKQGFRVTSVTISKEQGEFARERIYDKGLDNIARIELMDYRNISGQFDYIVSIGMFEHVGENYWPVYFEKVKSLLKPVGKAMIQSIVLDGEVFEKNHDKRGFIEQVIFPGGCLPSQERFRKCADKAGLFCKEMFTFGGDYALTLTEWLRRFEASKAEVRMMGYDEYFIRMWRFYLASCIGSFSAGRTSVMQAEITHNHDV